MSEGVRFGHIPRVLVQIMRGRGERGGGGSLIFLERTVGGREERDVRKWWYVLVLIVLTTVCVWYGVSGSFFLAFLLDFTEVGRHIIGAPPSESRFFVSVFFLF